MDHPDMYRPRKTMKGGLKNWPHKIINFLTFVDLPIRRKFLLFIAGSIFWFAAVAAMNFIATSDINVRSRWILQTIGPHQETGNIVLRKVRGAGISVFKIALYHDKEDIKKSFNQAKERLDDSRTFLKVLLSGGIVKDYSRVTGQIYKEILVRPLMRSESRIPVEEAIANITTLERLLGEITDSKLKRGKVEGIYLDKLNEYDAITQDTVNVLSNYVIDLSKEWENLSHSMDYWFTVLMILSVSIFIIGTLLSVFFGILIARNLEKPIRAMISKFQALSAGKPDFSRVVETITKDELKELSYEFNNLMETIAVVTSFKKIIEGDETVEDVFIRLGKVFTRDLGFTNCIIYETDPLKQAFKVVYSSFPEGIQERMQEIDCSDIQYDCCLCRAKRTGQIVSSFESPDVCKHFTDETKSYVCIPVTFAGRVEGVINFTFDKEHVIQHELDKRIGRVQQYLNEAQPVLEAKSLMQALRESTIRDELTGLYNRRFLQEIGEGMVLGVTRRGTILGVLMCDLDFFKEVNDTYGHDVGDMVLRETARIIHGSVRTSDVIIRFGGEEFLALLLDTRPDDAADVAEKIRKKVEQTKFDTNGYDIQKTISVGVSECPVDAQNLWEAIKFADVALYKAKETGRNKVVRFEANMWLQEKY